MNRAKALQLLVTVGSGLSHISSRIASSVVTAQAPSSQAAWTRSRLFSFCLTKTAAKQVLMCLRQLGKRSAHASNMQNLSLAKRSSKTTNQTLIWDQFSTKYQRQAPKRKSTGHHTLQWFQSTMWKISPQWSNKRASQAIRGVMPETLAGKPGDQTVWNKTAKFDQELQAISHERSRKPNRVP